MSPGSGHPRKKKFWDIAPYDADGSITAADRGRLGLSLSRINGSSGAVVYTHPTFGKCLKFVSGTMGMKTANTTMGGLKVYTLNFDFYALDNNAAQLVTRVTWNSGGSSFGLYRLSDGRLQLYFNGGQRVWSTATAINTAYNVRVVINGQTITLYLNGVSQGSYTTSGYAEQNLPIGVGSAVDASTAMFNGFIKNLWIAAGVVLT